MSHLEGESISRYVGSRLWNLLEEIHRVAWKNIYSNTTGLDGLVGPSGYCY